ncbi:MAG TPA: hypothetical protein VKP03_02310 [Patescibacteria group bacterium]|nr:hypothetical protein [Patescibacteria group bacterium]
MDFFDYKKILALVILAILVWIGIVLYRVGREGLIKRVDFWKSKWKIVLFWMIVAVVVLIGWYYLDKFGVLDKFLRE